MQVVIVVFCIYEYDNVRYYTSLNLKKEQIDVVGYILFREKLLGYTRMFDYKSCIIEYKCAHYISILNG